MYLATLRGGVSNISHYMNSELQAFQLVRIFICCFYVASNANIAHSTETAYILFAFMIVKLKRF